MICWFPLWKISLQGCCSVTSLAWFWFFMVMNSLTYEMCILWCLQQKAARSSLSGSQRGRGGVSLEPQSPEAISLPGLLKGPCFICLLSGFSQGGVYFKVQWKCSWTWASNELLGDDFCNGEDKGSLALWIFTLMIFCVGSSTDWRWRRRGFCGINIKGCITT